MIECPVCREDFAPDRAVTYLTDQYCSDTCAEIAAREGKNASEPVEAEQQSKG